MTLPSKPFRPLSRKARKIPRKQYNWMGGVCERMSGLVNAEGRGLDMPRTPLTSKIQFVEVTDSLTGEASVLYKTDYVQVWTKGDWFPITVGTYGWTEFALPLGERVWVQYHEQSRQWIPLYVPLVRVELKEDLVQDSSAEAYLLEYTGGAYNINPAIIFDVYDGIDTFEGDGRSGVSTYAGNHGDRGYAKWAGDRLVWEWIQLACEDA